jgi:hypothetical protein
MPAWIAGIQTRRMRPETSMSTRFRLSLPERRHVQNFCQGGIKLHHYLSLFNFNFTIEQKILWHESCVRATRKRDYWV